MKNKKIFFFLFLILIIFLYFFIIENNCKSLSSLKKYSNLNISLTKKCVKSFNHIFGQKKKAEILKKSTKMIKNEKYYNNKSDIIGFYSNLEELKKLSVSSKKNKKFKNWYRSHANNYNNKFINTENFSKDDIKNLKLISKIDASESNLLENGWQIRHGINPIFAEDKIFYVTSNFELVAISINDFSIVWKNNLCCSISKRGFLYHKDKLSGKSFILINSGSEMLKLNPDNGELVKNFGNNGLIETGVVHIPPVIFDNQIIVIDMLDANIKIFDLFDGSEKYNKSIFSPDDNYFANPWGGSALDEKNGIYYFVTGNPKPGVMGFERPGPNKYANAIIAFDLKKKKIIWSFQDVIHDLWDLDVSAPPIIADLNIKNLLIEVIIMTTKTGNTYIFERKTGKSLFDIKYKEVESSSLRFDESLARKGSRKNTIKVNEYTSPVQPAPTLPKNFSNIEFKKDDLRDKFLKNDIFMKNFNGKHEFGWFKPPKIGKDIILYGISGGNNWVGSAYDPFTQNIFIPSNHRPYKIIIQPKSREKDLFNDNLKFYSLYQKKCSSCHGATRNGKWKTIDDFSDFMEYFVPSLVGLTVFEELNDRLGSYSKFLDLHKNIEVSEKEYNNLVELFKNWDQSNKANKDIFLDGGWTLLIDDNGDLLSKPPWGTITSINIANGQTNWKKPFGTRDGNNIGLFNYGGVSVTSSGLLIATGTTDKMVYIIDTVTGENLWEYKMESEGTSAPIIFNYKGETYFAINANGGLTPQSKKTSILYIFGIKKD
jgi:quinoprotein glucose dehydrogenase